MAKSKGGMTIAKAAAVVKPIADEMGLDIWDIQYLKEGTEWCLRIIIDKEGGVDILDCERLSRAIDKPLDELDPIDGAWSLEVSSPGIERALTKPEHYEKMAGRDIAIQLYRPHEETGEKEIIASLVELRDKMIVLEDLEGTRFEIALKDAVSVRLYEEIEE